MVSLVSMYLFTCLYLDGASKIFWAPEGCKMHEKILIYSLNTLKEGSKLCVKCKYNCHV